MAHGRSLRMQLEFSPSDIARFWAKVHKTDTCWLWTGSTHRGYGQLSSPSGRGHAPLRAPRVSWEIHYGPIPEGLWVLHRCDVRGCVRPDHLWLGTRQDNIADMVAKGRSARGERSAWRQHPERFPYPSRTPAAPVRNLSPGYP